MLSRRHRRPSSLTFARYVINHSPPVKLLAATSGATMMEVVALFRILKVWGLLATSAAIAAVDSTLTSPP
ncbi:hypothetical protein DY000_02024237 [Brassica cretica]|uniref:Uncharacterized protein n=1 Tax=Brassica cretica TaxID=69181 RepID=A0ABQ7EAW2_BRACR|nr:hypothetical protein DY000_02024237 [Brassica cretica]